MKTYDTNNLRNVCLVGHGGSGKTSLTEAFLFNSGAVTRIGKVTEGNTISDYLPEEVSHQVSISTSLTPFEWQGVKVNILDTPGYLDFYGEVKGALSVAECGLLVLCGVSGLEVQAEITFNDMEEQKKPRVVFVNKLDRKNANFNKVLDQLRDAYPNARFIPLQIPVGQEEDFLSVIDVLDNKECAYAADGSGKVTQKDVPAAYQDEVESLREQLAEAVAEADDDILMKYLEGEKLNDEELRTALRQALKQNLFIPVLCGSAFRNIGIANLMNFLAGYAPAPEADPDKAALVFKTLADPYVGKMSFFKVYGGTFTAESQVYDSTRETEEKIGQPFYLRGKSQEPVASVPAGDIAVVAKLQDVKTGDTLCAKDKHVTLPSIAFPVPTLAVAIAPKSKGDEDKLGSALSRLADEDPTISIDKNIETKELILTGLGELHLDIFLEKLTRKFGVAVEKKVPKVPYRETLRKSVKVEGKHKKQTGGHGQYGHVWLNVEPSEEMFEFAESVFGGSVPRQYFPAVEKGVREALAEGTVVGYPVTGVKVTLLDGSYHPVDSSEMAFKLAAIMAFRKGMDQASPALLEPVVEVEIVVPETFMGDVIGDLNGKRGRVLGMEAASEKFQLIRAHVPQSEMMRYAIDLRALTQGRGSFKMDFYQYEEVPARLTEALVSQLKTDRAE